MEHTRHIIVMVDDNPTILVAGKTLLKSAYEVYTVPSAERLFSLMEKVTPDLILLDVEMPGMSGYEAINILKGDEKTADIPVIFLTGKTDSDSELEGLSLGAIDYISKPFAGILLKKRIENILLTVSQTRKLKTMNEQLVRANNAKSRFLAQVSHEIRTPMNAIIGLTDLMRTDNLDKTQLAYFYDIRQMGRALLEIINDILDFSKIESGKMDIVPVDFNLPELFDHICSVNRFLAVNKDLEFRSRYDETLPEVLFSDETRIRQVITNLIGNAIKYTRTGYVELSFFKTARDEKNYLAASVVDTGVGIREEDYDKLFTTFGQLDIEKNRSIGGTGLGLAITKRLLGILGGFIEFSSEYGKGSVFTAYFPLVEGNAEKIVQSRIVDAVLARGNVSVLVVDDNAVNLTVAQGYLNTHNIFPDTAISGGEAIEMVKAKNYDLVFMDHMMPAMDGIETAQHIRNLSDGKFKALPIVALTANAVTGVKEMMLEAGMDDFISKPIEAAELNAVLLKWLPREKIEIRREESSAVLPIAQSTGFGVNPYKRTQQARIWQASIQRQGGASNAAAEPAATVPAETDDAILEKVKSVAGVDVKSGLMYLGGKPSSYLRTIKRFCEEFSNYRAALETAISSGDWNDYTIRIHALKSSCAALGFNDLSARAASLEKTSRGGQTDVCISETPKFCEEGQRLRDELAAIVET